MNSEIFIEANTELTLKVYAPIASQTMSLITEAAEGVDELKETFSIDDLSALLNKGTVHMAGEFEIHRTPSHYCRVVYKPYVLDEAEFGDGYRFSDFVDTPADRQNCLWVNEKVLIAFIDRKLYGVAFMLYFYLGSRMTRDAAFAVSQHITFEKIVESCDAFPEGCRVKHQTTLMRALADLQDAGLIKWNAKRKAFELLYITPYDPSIKV